MGCTPRCLEPAPLGISVADCLLLVVEHYRNLWNFVQVVYENEADGKSICTATTCPRMSAGPYGTHEPTP